MSKRTMPRIPVTDLEAIVQAQVVYLVLIQSAVEQIPNLPQEPYQLAFNLAKTQLDHILKDLARRTSPERTQALFDECYRKTQPVQPATETLHDTIPEVQA